MNCPNNKFMEPKKNTAYLKVLQEVYITFFGAINSKQIF